jgi:DNA-binding MarR family transcriptional regulator
VFIMMIKTPVRQSPPVRATPPSATSQRQPKPLSRMEYLALAEFRYQLRRYLRHMEQHARARSHHPQQYQLLLAIKGLPEPRVPTISVLAERMQMNHNSIVELADRCEKRGLVSRTRSYADRRQVTLAITAQGEKVLREQASASRDELRNIGPILVKALNRLLKEQQQLPRVAGFDRRTLAR